MTRVLVTGSRTWTDAATIGSVLGGALDASVGPLVVVHGGARGADAIAGAWCAAHGVEQDVYPAAWRENGRAAGPIRNVAMLRTAPDIVFAFQRDGSRGTQHCIDAALALGVPVVIIRA